MVDDDLAGIEPSWELLRQSMEKAMQLEFPKKRIEHRRFTARLWDYRRILRELPEVLLAMADMHAQLKQRIVWRSWAAIARQSAAARTAKRRKFEQRQKLIDDQLAQAEAKSSKDGSHSLYKVIRSFKTGKTHERVQLRDSQGRFLTAKEERRVLEDYSTDLFGTGDDFQLRGATGSLGITTADVRDQLRSIKLGKAAFDMVDRGRLRESLELAQADPFLIDLVRSYSQDTCENNQKFMQRRGLKTAEVQVLKRLSQFLKRQHKGDKAAMNPELQIWLMESCALCGQALAGNKAVKQSKSTQSRPPRAQLVGLPDPVFILEGFWLLANRRNHCYANSVLQILHWVAPPASLPALQEGYRTSQLARITPEHQVLDSVTRGWTFDGNQQDAAEFLSAILPNLSEMKVCCWETRSPMEAGYVVDEEGISPIFLCAPLAEDLQTMINRWSSQMPVRALVAAEQFVFLAVPRYAGDGKNSSPIRLQELLLIPAYEGVGSTMTWHSFRLRAGVVHLGEEPTSGHYRSLIRAEEQWYLADDSRPPTACQINDPLITGNCYLLLLERQQAELEDFFRNAPMSDISSKRGEAPSQNGGGQGKGKQAGQRHRDGKPSEAADDDLVNAALKDRVVKVSQSETVQQKLKQEGVMTLHGERPYFERSSGSQSMVESLEDPLSTSQLLSGLGDVISRLEADSTQVTMFKTSRPIGDNMTGGPVRLLFQFSCKVGTSELLDSLGTLANNSAFSLLNGDFQKQGAQPSPLIKQIRNMLR
ncbi:hypothetical protein AK812_SmicGene37389 [Symbiodinium microadriaticum]|uniref:USP domain-containing protein n=1 Tax=Symbiodinium microadriaticum TaxID=2951 RepID=A0A1Q9CGF8_SYMMI|nr:hypothetical protein AK812_SmicGene37389 [Symbiodinium microadriaticum]